MSTYALCSFNNYIFAGVPLGVFFSTNNGLDWYQSGLTNKTVISFAVKDNIIFAGTSLNGIFKSSNMGNNWTQVSQFQNLEIKSICVLDNYIFAATGGGLYRSSNNGNNWVYIGFGGTDITSLSSNSNKIFLGTYNYSGYGTVYYSTNFGLNWTATNFNKNVSVLYAINNYIFAGAWDQGLFISTNSGNNWFVRNEGLPGGNLTFLSVKIMNEHIYTGTYYFNKAWRRLNSEIISVKKISETVPEVFLLEQNFPNPFNSITNIKFQIIKSGNVSLKVYDILGKEVAVIVYEHFPTGSYEVSFNAEGLTSGIYFCRLTAGDFSQIKKMILLK
jgi:hypothetical protein